MARILMMMMILSVFLFVTILWGVKSSGNKQTRKYINSPQLEEHDNPWQYIPESRQALN